MKKLLLLFALVISVAASSVAQNANRSGVFVEAGTGFLVGSVPFKDKIEWKNNTLTAYKPGGPDINLAVGYRRATSSVFAWEFKFETSSTPQAISTLVLAFMPGIRYTTKEIFGNTSLYFGFDVGFAMGYCQEQPYSSFISDLKLDSDEQSDLDLYFESFGVKFSVSAGFNITTSFYAGLYWDYNVVSAKIFNYESLKKDGMSSNWGSLGLRLGYRF